MSLKIMSVVGARPNFMKIAPFVQELARHGEAFDHFLVHTGQHYDEAMSRSFVSNLDIPEPDINLCIGSGSHAEQVGRTMIEFEKVVRHWAPDWIVVVGDVNATCACSIVAKKEGVKLAHIEAGLRSFDLEMPEEINRMVTDRLSDLLFTPDEISSQNLRNEGVPEEKIELVGNIMIDTLEKHRDAAQALNLAEIIRDNAIQDGVNHRGHGDTEEEGRGEGDASCLLKQSRYGGKVAVADGEEEGNIEQKSTKGTKREESSLTSGFRSKVSGLTSPVSDYPARFSVLTLHRPSNVDHREVFQPLVRYFIDEASRDMPIVWTLHPRTRKQLDCSGLLDEVLACPRIILLNPVGYHEMLKLNMSAKLIFTDSGGLQEESCVLGTPCLTLRFSTERPVTLREHGGTCELVGNDIEKIRKAYVNARHAGSSPVRPALWDGRTAERIVEALGIGRVQKHI